MQKGIIDYALIIHHNAFFHVCFIIVVSWNMQTFQANLAAEQSKQSWELTPAGQIGQGEGTMQGTEPTSAGGRGVWGGVGGRTCRICGAEG